MGCRHPLNDTTLDSQAIFHNRGYETSNPKSTIHHGRYCLRLLLQGRASALTSTTRPTSSNGPSVAWQAHDTAARGPPKREAHYRSGMWHFGRHHLLPSPRRRPSWAQSDHLANAERSAIFLGMGDAVDGHVADPRGMCGVSSPDESPSSHFDFGDHSHAVEFLFPHPRGPPPSTSFFFLLRRYSHPNDI